MNTALKSITLAAVLGLAAGPALSAEKVAIGVPSWTGAQAIANLLKAVVELRIGGEVTLVPGNNATIFQAMDQGKGDIDVHPDVWLPNQESFTKKYVDENGECCVDVETSAMNQRGKDTAPGESTIILPSREKSTCPLDSRLD